MPHQHYLPMYEIKGYRVFATKTDERLWKVEARDLQGKVVRTRAPLSRMSTLVYLSLFGRLSYFDSLEKIEEKTDQMLQHITTVSGSERFAGVDFEVFYFPTENTWSLEFEPGMGTTQAAMNFRLFEDCLDAVMGVVHLLANKYLVRASSTS